SKAGPGSLTGGVSGSDTLATLSELSVKIERETRRASRVCRLRTEPLRNAARRRESLLTRARRAAKIAFYPWLSRRSERSYSSFDSGAAAGATDTGAMVVVDSLTAGPPCARK